LTVHHYVRAIGRDAAAYGGHSLRAGFATAAAGAGVHERDIMRQTRHHSTAMVRRYIRDGGLFCANAAGALGL
jgi:integrase